jgi:hypothetical protein
MEQFEPGKGPDDVMDLRYWRRSIVIGTPEAVEKMCKSQPLVQPKTETKAESIVRPKPAP